MRGMKRLCVRFDDATARIDRTIMLAGAIGDNAMAEDAEEFFRDEDFETIEGCFGPLPSWVKEGIEADDIEAVIEWLFREEKLGFLIKVATPIMEVTGENSFRYSWGRYTYKWVYGDTFNAAVRQGFAFVRKQRSKEKAKANTASE